MPRVKLFDEEEVLTKAMNLFWKQGYSATSVQDLVSHLGINRASIYDTYGDKEKLFLKALEQYRKINVQGVSTFFENQPNVKEGLRLLFEQAIEESIQDNERKGCFVVNTITELIPGDEKLLCQLGEHKATFEALFHEYLKKGEADGQLAPGKDLKAIASLLFTYFNGIRVVSKVDADRAAMLNSLNVALQLLD